MGAANADTREDPPPAAAYVFSDEEIRRLFHAIDTQPLSEMSNRALVDPVLFRVLYATGLFSRGHRPWRKSGLRVCAAQRLME
jgi:integrase